jgi:hypothetical protein
MNKTSQKSFTVIMIVFLFILSNFFTVKSAQPIISSRVSEITEIAVSTSSGLDKPDSTEFEIKAVVEILNRGDENYSLTVGVDCFPKVRVNVVFVNKSLSYEQGIWCQDMSRTYIYPPGITVEPGDTSFYINQTGLTQLPDGNYTLHRAISVGKQYKTIILVNSGVMEIIYNSFYYNRTEADNPENNTDNTDETYFLLISPILFSIFVICAKTVYSKRRTKISRN